jgi:tetratricopeptide (TPR) repeat protein
MTTASGDPRQTDGPARHRPDRLRRALVVLGGAALALGIGRFIWLRATAPQPPAVDLEGVDPAIAAAVGRAQEAVRQAPRSAPAWGLLGMVLLTHQFNSPANLCFERAEAFEPGEPRWPYYRGVALLDEDPDAALPPLRRAVELCGDTPPAPRLRLAEALLKQDRLDEAEEQFRAALRGDSGNALASLGLGRLAYRRGRLPEGLEHVGQSLARGGPPKTAHLLLAQLYQQLGKPTDAENESHLAAALRDDAPPPDPFLEALAELRTGKRADAQRARQLLAQGRAAEAVTLLARVVSDYPDYPPGWLLLGRAYVRQKDWPAAERALNRAIGLDPDNPEHHLQLGVALYHQGDARAPDCFHTALQLKPDCAPAHYNLGLWLARQGDLAGAIDAFRQAVRYQPDLAEAYVGLGTQLALQGRLAEAVEALSQAVRLNPEDRQARQLLDQAREKIAVPVRP